MNNTMNTVYKTKRFLAAVALAAALAAGGCNRDFEEKFDMAVDSNALIFDADEGRITFGCYCDGKWEASLSEEISWGALDRTSGKGTAFIRFSYSENTGLSRMVNVILRGNGKEQIIRLTQRPGLTNPKLAFDKNSLQFAAGAYEGRLTLDTNLPETLLEELKPVALYDEGEGDWISDLQYHPSRVATDSGEDAPESAYVSFKIAENAGDKARKASIAMSTTDAEGKEYRAETVIDQSNCKAYIDFADVVVSKDEHQGIAASFASNISSLYGAMTVSTAYEGDAKDYISNIAVEEGAVTFDCAANDGIKRSATITVSHTDLNGTVTEGVLKFLQRGEVMPRTVTVEALRAMQTSAGSQTYPSDEDYRDYITVRVTSDKDDLNTEKNPNTSVNRIDFTATAKTGYAQSEDGKYGFRLQFATAADNTLHRGDKIRLYLDGKTLTMENSPKRYTLSGIKADDIEVEAAGSPADIVSKERTIATLTDEDVYTCTTLTDMEFVVKDGPYTYTTETMLGCTASNQFRDNLATMMQDADNNAIYALINSKCAWRRDSATGKHVPQGVGRVNGIIVHTEDPAYGDMGKYQIRPIDEASFDIPAEESSATNVLARWSLTKETVSIGQYAWNGGAATVNNGGYKIGNATTMQQNKMHATHGLTDGSAVLYSTNLTIINGATTGHPTIVGGTASAMNNYSYQPGIINGTKGTNNLATATNGHNDMHGQSKSTALIFRHDVASYYEWSSGNWTGGTTGIVLEFPATSATGTLAVSFTTSAMQVGTTNNANKSTKQMYKGLTHSFPLYWKVECSTDGGTTWTKCTNTVNGSEQFEMRSTVNYMNPQSLTNPVTSSALNVYTPLAMPSGFIQEKFTLPASAAGAAKVMVKISPASLRLAWFGSSYTSSIDTGIDCTPTLKYPSAFMLEDVVISYK